MIEKYYEEELRYLYESGKEFAKAHPERARFLNIDSLDDRDPYVERLFEGFAFCAAHIREKLDDSVHLLIEGIINLLWPQLLYEIPSVAIMQFAARSGLLQNTESIPRGSEVVSKAVGQDAVACKFVTTQDVLVHPMTLSAVEHHIDTKGSQIITFSFCLESGVAWNDCSIQKLPLYIHADVPTASMIHENLTTQVSGAQIVVNNGQYTIDLDPGAAVTPGGMTVESSLLPRDSRAFWGHGLLREYFIFPEKFFFVELHGFDTIPLLDPQPTVVTYTLTMRKTFAAEKPFCTDSFRLYCSPIVNLFLQETEPVIRTNKRMEYPVVADYTASHSIFVHHITTVIGIDRITGIRSHYKPLYTFRQRTIRDVRTFNTRFQRSVSGKREVVVIFGTSSESLCCENSSDENISITAWCTNGELPRDYLKEGDINKPGKNFPDYIRLYNITRPTLPCLPPDESDYLWMFQSQLSAPWASLGSPETLQCFLKTFDWSRQEGRNRRIEAISDVAVSSVQKNINGCNVRGVHMMLTIREQEFRDSGDIHLFGMILNEFFRRFISINSFLDLTLSMKPSGRKLSLSTIEGTRCRI